MANVEREIADEILSASRQSASKLGLRFDRVAVRVLSNLRAFAEATAPVGLTLIVTISAPIRLSAKTVTDLKPKISLLLSEALVRDHAASIHGNEVHMKLIENSSNRSDHFIGFVHNGDSEPALLMNMAEQWVGLKP